MRAVLTFSAASLLFVGLFASCSSDTKSSGGAAGGNATGGTAASAPLELELLNVSYDPTRELWRDLNDAFIPKYQQETGTTLTINQSHGGSSTQARAVIDGLEADVVTLAMWPDTNAIHEMGLIADNWEERLPYYSTIVFVVRKGNPQNVKDWSDLVDDANPLEIVTPNPKTSGNGKLSFLAAWGYVVTNGGSDEAAQEFVTKLYRRTPVLDSGARGSTTTFVQKKIGDVHLAWENEAHLEVAEAGGELELIYPSLSIRAEPHVTVVDGNVDRRGTRAAAEAYLKFLYTDQGQEIIGRHHYRPNNEEIGAKFTDTLPPLKLFSITDIAPGWDEANAKFFAEGALFDQIYQPQ